MAKKLARFFILMITAGILSLVESDIGICKGLPPEEGIEKVLYLNKKNGKIHARSEVVIKRDLRDQDLYQLTIKGKGSYDHYSNVNWIKEAELKEQEGLLYVQRSSTKVYSKNVLLTEFRKTYDYNLKKVTLEVVNEQGKVIKEKNFSIKGPICDEVTLVHFLNPFISMEGNEKLENFYLLTNEFKLYEVVIKDRGEETLDLPSGRVQTNKFQLMADLGSLTELATKVVPPTYVWYAQNSPYDWIQYEGMESGLNSVYIQAYKIK